MRDHVIRCRLILAFGFVAAIALLVSSGCSSKEFAPVEGVISLDGNPLADATVIFQAPSMPLATAKTNEAGHYRVETGSSDGMKPGEYVVTVAAFKTKKNSDEPIPILFTPKRYVKAESSGLKAIIVDGTNRHVDFDLNSKL